MAIVWPAIIEFTAGRHSLDAFQHRWIIDEKFSELLTFLTSLSFLNLQVQGDTFYLISMTDNQTPIIWRDEFICLNFNLKLAKLASWSN